MVTLWDQPPLIRVDLTRFTSSLAKTAGRIVPSSLRSGSPLLPDPGQFLRQRDRFLMMHVCEEAEPPRRRGLRKS